MGAVVKALGRGVGLRPTRDDRPGRQRLGCSFAPLLLPCGPAAGGPSSGPYLLLHRFPPVREPSTFSHSASGGSATGIQPCEAFSPGLFTIACPIPESEMGRLSPGGYELPICSNPELSAITSELSVPKRQRVRLERHATLHLPRGTPGILSGQRHRCQPCPGHAPISVFFFGNAVGYRTYAPVARIVLVASPASPDRAGRKEVQRARQVRAQKWSTRAGRKPIPLALGALRGAGWRISDRAIRNPKSAFRNPGGLSQPRANGTRPRGAG